MSNVNRNGTVPQNILRIIQKKGVKQCVIASRAGYTKQQFSDMVNGRKIIKAVDVLIIAEALGVTPNDLYGIVEAKDAS